MAYDTRTLPGTIRRGRGGEEVASGIVGGDPVSLPPGSYTVEVLTDPVLVLEDVVIAPGMSRRIEVGDPAAPPEPSPAPGVSQ